MFPIAKTGHKTLSQQVFRPKQDFFATASLDMDRALLVNDEPQGLERRHGSDRSRRAGETGERATLHGPMPRVTFGQNDVVKRSAKLCAILAVRNMVFSWYGMNFQVMPELKW
jgi:hypothetical protein